MREREVLKLLAEGTDGALRGRSFWAQREDGGCAQVQSDAEVGDSQQGGAGDVGDSEESGEAAGEFLGAAKLCRPYGTL